MPLGYALLLIFGLVLLAGLVVAVVSNRPPDRTTRRDRSKGSNGSSGFGSGTR